jgi:hypothetical protein
MAQAIPVVAGCYWKATTDASGNIGCTLTSEYFPYSSGFTLGESGSGARPTAFADELGLKPIINSVDAVVTCLAGGTDIDAEWLIWNYEEVDSSNGGFTIYVGLHSDNASVVYTFETFVFGYCTPMVI